MCSNSLFKFCVHALFSSLCILVTVHSLSVIDTSLCMSLFLEIYFVPLLGRCCSGFFMFPVTVFVSTSAETASAPGFFRLALYQKRLPPIRPARDFGSLKPALWPCLLWMCVKSPSWWDLLILSAQELTNSCFLGHLPAAGRYGAAGHQPPGQLLFVLSGPRHLVYDGSHHYPRWAGKKAVMDPPEVTECWFHALSPQGELACVYYIRGGLEWRPVQLLCSQWAPGIWRPQVLPACAL